MGGTVCYRDVPFLWKVGPGQPVLARNSSERQREKAAGIAGADRVILIVSAWMKEVGQMPLKCLKKFRVQDLEPGMILGKTILNEKGQVMLDQGKVILQEGTLISRELIDRLRNWNICVVDVQIALPLPKAKPVEEEPLF